MLKLVKLQENNQITMLNKIYDFKNPLNIYIPNITDTYKLDDYVYKYIKFGNFVSSISGYIKGTKKVLINGKYVNSLIIENDFQENKIAKKRTKKIDRKDDLINILKEYSLSKVSEKILEMSDLKNLVISSIDEEEYSAKEFIRLSHNYDEVLDIVDYLINLFELKKAILATKNTNFKSIKNVKSILGTYPNIKINLVPDKYLISYKKFLCEYLNLKEDETLILTTSEVYDIYKIIKKGKYITENLITISGNAIEKSLIINVRLYTSLKEIINEYIKIIDEEYEIFINGYLGGKKVDNLDEVIITKDINSIIINRKVENYETECINCGACQKICPFNINVKKCYFYKLSHKHCIGCGLCNYICPAKLKLKEIVMSDANEK